MRKRRSILNFAFNYEENLELKKRNQCAVNLLINASINSCQMLFVSCTKKSGNIYSDYFCVNKRLYLNKKRRSSSDYKASVVPRHFKTININLCFMRSKSLCQVM